MEEITREDVMAHAENKEYLLKVAGDKETAPFIEFATEALRDDKELVLKAVTSNGNALEFASDRLKADKEVVLAAVQNAGWVACYASEELRDDKEIILTAVKKEGQALYYS